MAVSIRLNRHQRAEAVELEGSLEPEELASGFVYYRDRVRTLEQAVDMAIEHLTKIPGDHGNIIEKLRGAKRREGTDSI